MERGYSENREQDSDYESDSGTTRQGLSIENDFGVGSLLPIATRMMESCTRAMERICDKVEATTAAMQETIVALEDFSDQMEEGYRERNRALEEINETLSKVIEARQPKILSQVMYNGVNLLELGGREDNEKARKIARQLWTRKELSEIVIDNTKRSGTRKAADQYRTKLFRDAMYTLIRKSGEVDQIFIDIRYKFALRSANGIGTTYAAKMKTGAQSSASYDLHENDDN